MSPRSAPAENLAALFAGSGFAHVEPPILQPAEVFLDVSGEELRRRLFLTTDPAGHELCLRPDLTIPTARLHVAGGDPGRVARYSYLGPVFRYRPDAPSEFAQGGAESFGVADAAAEDAAMLGLAVEAVRVLGAGAPTIRIGDVGLLAALVREHRRLGDDDAVTVSEIACGDPACGGAETVVLVMRPGRRTEATKLKKAMALVEPADVEAAWPASAPPG